MGKRKSKRILFIVQLPPPTHGVSAMNIQLVNSPIIQNNYDIDIINFQFTKSVKGIAKFSFSKIFKALAYGFQMIRKMLFNRPDLVYFTISPNGVAFYRDAIYVLILKTLNAKLMYHLHGKGIKQLTEDSAWKKALYKWVFKNTEVICLSERLTKDIEGVYAPKPHIVFNGIEPLKNLQGPKRDPAKKIPSIFYLSNFFTTKGILVLIESLKLLKEQGHRFEARFAGAPGDLSLEYLNETVDKAGLSDCTKVLGPLYGSDKFEALDKADLFVHPTYNDAFPLVIIEAMQSKLPVISTYEGGIPNIIVQNETGFLVESRKPELLAEKIAVLLEDEEMRLYMGNNGFKRFKNDLTLEAFEKNMDKVFREVLGIKPSIEIPIKNEVKFDMSDRMN